MRPRVVKRGVSDFESIDEGRTLCIWYIEWHVILMNENS